MAQPLSVPPSGFDELPVEEQIEYVQALWRRIARKPDDVPSPAWHLEVLETRLEAMGADGESGRPWNEVRKDLHARLRAAHK